MDLKKVGVRLAALFVVFGLLACNKEEKAADNSCKADSDCKNSTLCEGGMCIPADVAKKAREPKKAEKKEEPKKEEKKEEPEKEWEGDIRVPKIPAEKSDPPTLPDWEKAAEVNTQHENGLAKNCSMKVIREWIRVMCTGDVLGFQDLQEFGKKKQDYFISVQKGKSFSLVGRIKQGNKQTVRVCRKDSRASLVVYWPTKRFKPEHIALGDGPKCTHEEYHDGSESEEEEKGTEEERKNGEEDDADHGDGGTETDDGDEADGDEADGDEADGDEADGDEADGDGVAPDGESTPDEEATPDEGDKPSLPKCAAVCPGGRLAGKANKGDTCAEPCGPGYTCRNIGGGKKRCKCDKECEK